MRQKMRDFAAILLAGGRSSRMGLPKGLLVADGEFWVLRQISALHTAGIDKIVLVLGPDREEYLKAIPHLAKTADLTIANNPDVESGPFGSLLVGAELLDRKRFSGVFVLPIDSQCARPDVLCRLAAEIDRDQCVKAVIPECSGKGGHPVLLSRIFLFDHLAKIQEPRCGVRLDHQIAALEQEELRRITVDDPNVLVNINTPSDWSKRGEKWGSAMGGLV